MPIFLDRHDVVEVSAEEVAKLHVKDVRAKSHVAPDVRAAQNFSYFVFEERAELLGYFKSAHRDLAPRGVFVIDIYGGPESMEVMDEVRKLDEGFTYVWDQRSYHPATGDYLAYIHFRFRDGSRMQRAFRYDWRLWTIQEVRELLAEAGFSASEAYWEGTGSDGEGNGIYTKRDSAENEDSWLAYVVGVR